MFLNAKEREWIDHMLARPVVCPARRYSEMLYHDRMTPEYLQDAEIFLSMINEQCSERWMFRRILEDYQLRHHVERKHRDDPTRQELDHKAWKKTFAITTDFLAAVRKKAGRLKKYAVTR